MVGRIGLRGLLCLTLVSSILAPHPVAMLFVETRLFGGVYSVDFGPLKGGSFSELPREATVFYHGYCLRVLMN